MSSLSVVNPAKVFAESEMYSSILKKQENPNYKITIVYGDRDIYKASKDFVINRYSTAKVLIIKDCGHLPWLHNPAEFKTILEKHYE